MCIEVAGASFGEIAARLEDIGHELRGHLEVVVVDWGEGIVLLSAATYYYCFAGVGEGEGLCLVGAKLARGE